MRTALLSCLAIILCIKWLPAQNENSPAGQKYPSFVELQEKPPVNQAKQIFKNLLGMEEKDVLVPIDTFPDDLGFTHLTFQQYYDGIKVDGGTYRLHVKNNHIWYMSGSYLDIFEELSTTPVQSTNAAFNQATNHVGANLYNWDETGAPPEAQLVIVADPEGIQAPQLAYKFDIYASAPLYRAFVYIDAQNGEFIKENLCIHHAEVNATGVSLYNGTVPFKADDEGAGYRLRQSHVQTFNMNNGTIHSQATDIISNTAHFTSDHTAVQAHWGAEQTYNYFLQKHNRNSFDNDGTKIRSYVHYSSNYNNAFWDGIRMTYGDGDGINFNPLVSIDIVGHEIAHGVTNYSADLVYSYESGALNESFSDIFGEAIERYATGSNDWSMGADIRVNGTGGIRSMSDPKIFGDPDTYKGTHWYSGAGDNGGVHTNSGVQNKWFYILSEGESGTNDLGDSYNVTGIGIEKAAAIAYRNLTVYLSAYSNYEDARNGAIQAAIDLYGEASNEVMATSAAWFAVGVGEQSSESVYCTSRGNNATFEWIAKVDVGSFSNASGSAGYTDFTSQNIDLTAGLSYSISLKPGFANATYGEYWKIWIDYNADGDFNDANELVYDAGGINNSTVNGTISIPPSATGTTRMRVSMKYNVAPSACETFNYGEVEDYTVTISSGNNNDTEPPSPPGNLTALNTTQTSTNLSWNSSTDNVGVIGYDIYLNGEYIGNTTALNFAVNGLTPGTTYTLSVIAKDAAGNKSPASTITITTPSDDSGPSYCLAQGNNANSEWITRVEIDNFSHSSGSDEYSDFTAFVANLTAGRSYDISLTPGYLGTTYNEYWRIWIDYNQDGDFEDEGELVFDAGNVSKTTVTGSISIPLDAGGDTRLRVAMRYNVAPSSCGSFNYGEVEDYTVSIHNDGGSDTQPPTPPNNLITSNTTPISTILSWNISSDNVGVAGYKVYLNNVYLGTTNSTSFNVIGLTPGTTYILSVTAKDAAGNESTPSSISVTTPNNVPDDVYCNSKGNNASAEWISEVVIGPFSNSSGSGGYSDFTALIANLTAGQTYDISLTPTFANQTYPEYWRIWIDYNQDGDFEDPGELAFDSGSASNTTVTGTITIPSSTSGNTRMRVSMKYNTAPESCGAFNYGEVEDYTVSISDDGGGGDDTGGDSETLFAHYFETGWDGWSDGGTDCFRYSGSLSWEGDYSIRLRDASGLASAMTSAPYDLSNYNELKIAFAFYANSMEYEEGFSLLYYDGNTWNTIASYESGIDFSNNQFYQMVVSFDKYEYNFPNNAQFRFQCNASSNQDQVYIDAVKVTVFGTAQAVITDNNQAPQSIPYTQNGKQWEEGFRIPEDKKPENIRLFPNPVQNLLQIDFNGDIEKMSIFSNNGVLIRKVMVGDNKSRIDVSELTTGIYYLSVQTIEGITTKKFVKK